MVSPNEDVFGCRWLLRPPVCFSCHGEVDAQSILSEGRLENMHDVIEVSGDRLKMKYGPADLIIVPR